MDIMEFGATGELIGSVTVVASLIFVGIQLRQNTKTPRRAGARETARHNQATLRALPDHSDLTAEFDRLDDINPAHLSSIEQYFADEREGLLKPAFLEPYRYDIRGVLASAAGERWWDGRKQWFTPSLEEEVVRLRADSSQVKPNEALSKHLVSRR